MIKIWPNRNDVRRAGDCSQPISIDSLVGLWFVVTRPMIVWQRPQAIYVQPADDIARLWLQMR